MGNLKYNISFIEENADYENMSEEELADTAQALKEYIKDLIAEKFSTSRASIEVDLEAIEE